MEGGVDKPVVPTYCKVGRMIRIKRKGRLKVHLRER